MDKQQQYRKWLEDQLGMETGQACKDEWAALIDLAATAMWSMHIINRDRMNGLDCYLVKSLPRADASEVAMRYVISTRAIRQMRNLEVIQ